MEHESDMPVGKGVPFYPRTSPEQPEQTAWPTCLVPHTTYNWQKRFTLFLERKFRAHGRVLTKQSTGSYSNTGFLPPPRVVIDFNMFNINAIDLH